MFAISHLYLVYESHSKPIIILPQNFGNTNKYTDLHSIYSFYYLTPTSFGIVDILRQLMPKLHGIV